MNGSLSITRTKTRRHWTSGWDIWRAQCGEICGGDHTQYLYIIIYDPPIISLQRLTAISWYCCLSKLRCMLYPHSPKIAIGLISLWLHLRNPSAGASFPSTSISAKGFLTRWRCDFWSRPYAKPNRGFFRTVVFRREDFSWSVFQTTTDSDVYFTSYLLLVQTCRQYAINFCWLSWDLTIRKRQMTADHLWIVE